MIVPEKSDRIRKITLPTWTLRALLFGSAAVLFFGMALVFDYLHMLSQVSENKRLRVENHELQVEVQSARNKVEALDQTVGRLKSFAHKLRVIANLDQPGMQHSLEKAPEGVKSNAPGEDSGIIEDEGPGEAAPKGKKKTSLHQPVIPTPPTEVPVEEDVATGAPSADADLHTRLEYQRSKTLVSDFSDEFESSSLTEQIRVVQDAAVKLKELAEVEEQGFADLQEQLQDRVIRLLSTPSLLPAQGYVSSEFGYRFNPFSGVRTFHAGLDIANGIGTPIYAPADGRVRKVGLAGGFGTVVSIDHGFGLITKYGHTSKVFVHDGDRVKRGQKIAEMGNSGRSTGPHVHYQVEMNGRPVQPRNFILDEIF